MIHGCAVRLGLRLALFVLSACATTTCLVSVAYAGTVIELQTTYIDGSQSDEEATIYLSDNRIRFDVVEEGKRTSLIFSIGENGEPLCWVIDKQTGTYIEIDSETALQIRQRNERVKRTTDDGVDNSIEGRNTEDKTGTNRQPGMMVEFKKVASGIRLKDWDCDQYESFVDGKKHEDVWTADGKTLGLEESNFEAFRMLGELFNGISDETNAFFQIGRGRSEGGFTGFPVVVVEFEDGREHEKSEVKSVRTEKIDEDIFELPEGARQQKMFGR